MIVDRMRSALQRVRASSGQPTGFDLSPSDYHEAIKSKHPELKRGMFFWLPGAAKWTYRTIPVRCVAHRHNVSLLRLSSGELMTLEKATRTVAASEPADFLGFMGLKS